MCTFQIRVQHRFQNITCRAGQAALQFTCPSPTPLPGTSTCPATVLNKGKLHCEDNAQNITCGARQIRVLLLLPVCLFLPHSLAISMLEIPRCQKPRAPLNTPAAPSNFYTEHLKVAFEDAAGLSRKKSLISIPELAIGKVVMLHAADGNEFYH